MGRLLGIRAARVALTLLLCLLSMPSLRGAPGASFERLDGERPNVVLITIDTLRADRISAYGYPRPTSPNMDKLIVGGVDFTQARTVEPLTNPAMCSMLTSRHPHQHGASRNGLRLRAGLSSLPKALQEYGYRTAAFVGSWTLRDKLSGLAEHFEHYEEVLTRKRWFGLTRREATAQDLNERTLDWIAGHVERHGWRPFLAWVHYVEPHVPYRLQRDFLSVLDTRGSNPSRKDRYDTEVAFVDDAIGELLERIAPLAPLPETLVVIASDHGESLGEHGYWGHGRHLYEPTLRIPMALYWKGRLAARTIEAPAVITDLAPTILGLIGLRVPSEFLGLDWTPVLEGAAPPHDRVTRFEAHRGAVLTKHESEKARRGGLLEVGLIRNDRKQIYRVRNGRQYVFDLAQDPRELNPLLPPGSDPSQALQGWLTLVYKGLDSHEDLPIEPLDEESIAALRSLGYLD